MRVQAASAQAVFWAQTPWEDHQSNSNGYLIFLYGNKYQFTSNVIIDLVKKPTYQTQDQPLS